MVFGRISVTWNKPSPHQRLPDNDDDLNMPNHLRNHDGYAHYTIPSTSAHGGGRPREYIVETHKDILVDSSHPVVIIDERSHHRGSRDHGHYSTSGHNHPHHLSGARSSSHAYDGSYSHSQSHNRLLSDSHSNYPPPHEYSNLPLHHHRDHRASNGNSNQLAAGQRKRPWLHPQHERCPPPHYGVGHTIAGFILCNEQLRRRGKEMRRSAFEQRRRERNYRRTEFRAEREAEKNKERHE